MSEKPSQRPAASKESAKTEGSAAPTGAKGGVSDKSKADDESFDFLSPPQGPGELGRLDHYRVLKLLGKGGMGMVFMAEDTLLHRIVALKVMLPSIAKKAIAKDRFIREARATAKIEHDHIVTIYQVSKEDSEVPYLAMQFLRGMTLEDWLKAGKTLNIPQIMRIGKEVAKALAAAHAQQLIHRDIKPSNIWLDAANKGRVKILDFGLARPTNEETHLTQEGMILGSPAYMSPEQARGQDVDERCDLFSLGCVMYRLCAGKLPFAGKDAMSMLLAITSEEPPALAQLNSDVPPALAELIHKLLAKAPSDRPASAKEVVQTIQSIERDWVANAKTAPHRPVTAAPTSHKDETIAAEAIDPALEESAITDLELQPTQLPASAQDPPAPRRGSWLVTGLGCAMAAVVSLMCCVAFLALTNFGNVQLEADETMTQLLKQAGGLVVRGEADKTYAIMPGEPQRLPVGDYHVDDSDAMKGFHVEPSRFTVVRNETLTLKVTPAVPPPPAKFVKPDVVPLTSGKHARAVQMEWAAYLKR
ncbi:MAG: protein kinase, partial [Planctomycetes bacterium]|nr:protein kinase [Planctomycetota bacterium]